VEPDFWNDCPAVERVPGRLDGRPVVKDSRVAAETIVESEDLGESAEETAYNYGLRLQDVLDVLSYAHCRKPPLAS
jgi:uncharacterized protein (DUF433 family)